MGPHPEPLCLDLLDVDKVLSVGPQTFLNTASD